MAINIKQWLMSKVSGNNTKYLNKRKSLISRIFWEILKLVKLYSLPLRNQF